MRALRSSDGPMTTAEVCDGAGRDRREAGNVGHCLKQLCKYGMVRRVGEGRPAMWEAGERPRLGS